MIAPHGNRAAPGVRVATNRLALVAALAVAPLLSCRDMSAPDYETAYRLEITPPGRAIVLKEQYTLQISSYNWYGVPLQARGARWSSSDPSVAAVDSNGVVTGLSLGSSVIKAMNGGLTAYMPVQIRPGDFRITMEPEVLAVGDTGIITVARLDYYGEVIASETGLPWLEWEENTIVEFPRLPGLAGNQLAVIGRTPGALFLWADGFGVAGSFWITVVPSSATR